MSAASSKASGMSATTTAPKDVFRIAPAADYTRDEALAAHIIYVDDKIEEAAGPAVAQISQALRIIHQDAEAQMHEPCSANELAMELECVRERVRVAYTLIEQAITQLCVDHGLEDYARGPEERARHAMRAATA